MTRQTNARRLYGPTLPKIAVLLAAGAAVLLFAVDGASAKTRHHRPRYQSGPRIIEAPFPEPAFDDPSSALHILPPLGDEPYLADATGFDATLIDAVTVSICEVGDESCTPVEEFTSNTGNPGHGQVRLRGKHYHVNWRLLPEDVGKTFEVHVLVLDLDLGFAVYTPSAPRTLPVIFRVDNHPCIRSRLLFEQGLSAVAIATALKDEFDLNQDEIAQLLLGLPLGRLAVAEALIVVFDLSASDAAELMYRYGYSARETYDVLMLVFDIQDERQVEDILFAAGYEIEEFIDFTALESVKRFAPILYFDRAARGFPMDAANYFEIVMHNDASPTSPRFMDDGTVIWEAAYYGPQPDKPGVIVLDDVVARDNPPGTHYGMQNYDFSKLENGEVPTYYKAISDMDPNQPSPPGPKGRLRIAYWWFYGFQEYCNSMYADGPAGEHYGDWEHIIVTTDPDRSRVDAVTYFLHNDWYTRKSPAFPQDNDRPVVYVGKLAHGSYHSQEEQGFGDDGTTRWPWHCCEYADWRNPNEDTKWYTVNQNLVSLRDTLYWMRADRVGSTFVHNGREYVVQNWKWGTSIPYMGWWFEWVHQNACGTHPTTVELVWTLASCYEHGCQGYSSGCAYSINPDTGWPWD